MSIAIEQTIHLLQFVLQMVPVGTNLALVQLLWSMVNGSFLGSRGAIFPAMQASGFRPEEIRRSWAAMRHGMWRLDDLLANWRSHVQEQGLWQAYEYEGYRPVAADLTAFWRRRLEKAPGSYFNGLANRLINGVGLALVVDVGHIAGQRIPLLRHVLCAHPQDSSEKKLQALVLKKLARSLAANEIALFDAGVKVSHMQAAGMARFVIRQAKNCTARRNYLPPDKGGRPNEYGDVVRPLLRQRKDKEIAASRPDKVESFVYQGRTIAVHRWYDLVSTTPKVADRAETFDILVFFDPLYLDPLVLATNVRLSAKTVFQLYLDRWPVERVPLVAKQTLGLSRLFVFAPESCLRLPELALLAGNILTYLAATLPPMPTGFWDRHPKKRPEGCGRSWPKLIFQEMPSTKGNFGKSSLSQAIYRRALTLIDGENAIPDHFSPFGLAI